MPSERIITRMEEILREVTILGGTQERTSMIPNLTVIDSAPSGLTGFIVIQDERDGDNILAKTVPSITYADNDKVNVLFIEGAEPIAFQQASQSSGSNSYWQLNTNEDYILPIDLGVSVGLSDTTINPAGAGAAEPLNVINESDEASIGVYSYTGTNANDSALRFYRSRGTDHSTPVAVADNDNVGEITWRGRGSSAFRSVAQIASEIDGTPSSNDVPGAIVFSVHALSDADNSVTERFRIAPDESVFNDTQIDINFRVEGNSEANLLFVDAGNDRVGINQAAPGAKLHITASGESARFEESSATGNPFVTFFQDGTRRSFIQHNDSSNNLIIASEFGIITFKTATGGSEQERMRVGNSGAIFINETTNTEMTEGLTINQGANDDEILTLKSSDVAHGITDFTETDSYGLFEKVSGGNGGLRVLGATESTIGTQIRGFITTETTTTATGSVGAVLIDAALKSGTGVTTLGATGNLLVVRNNATARYIFQGDGTAYADVAWSTFSDSRLKRDITDLSYNLETVMSLNPKEYIKYSGNIEDGIVSLETGSAKRGIGFLAQDIKEIIPEIVSNVEDEDNKFYALNYDGLLPVVIQAIKDLKREKDAEMNQLLLKLENLERINNVTN